MRALQPAKTAKTTRQSQKRHEIQTVGLLPGGRWPETYTVDGAARILKLTPGRVGQMLRAGDFELSEARLVAQGVEGGTFEGRPAVAIVSEDVLLR
jgi:hypothetical protein